MPEIITDAGQVTPEWLTAVLDREGCLSGAHVVAVQETPAPTAPDSHNSRVHFLRVTYSAPSPAPKRLFLKMSARPEPEMGGREVEFYSTVARAMLGRVPEAELPFVRCYDAAYSPALSRFHLLLEDLSETHTTPDRTLPPSVVHCEGAVDALATLHAFWWEHPRLGRDLGQRYTAERIDGLSAWAGPNLAAYGEFMGDRLSPERRALLERVCSAWPERRRERLIAGRGITIVNRDTHAANMLYPRDPASRQVRIIDWQSWRVDTGTDDLAYMMAAHWYPERRARLETVLLRRYHARLLSLGVQGYSWEDCREDYRASVVRVLFFLVGGWHAGRPISPFWDRVERTWLAFEELGCEEILPG
jgi:hypothetical protein